MFEYLSVNIEILNPDGSVEESKMTYSRPNVFRMDAEDLVLAQLANAEKRFVFAFQYLVTIKTPLSSGLILISKDLNRV